MLKLKLLYYRHLMQTTDLEKLLMQKDCRQKEKAAEDEMVR